MTNLLFSELNLTPKVQKAIDEMGFEMTTSIQSQAIPLIRTGIDVIGRSQTGTGKTIAFAIPAIEKIDTHEDKPTVQVLILCPTRELAQQACDEIRRLCKYKTGINPVDVYGGASMDRQIMRLKRANIVIGTPGRVMDHMRRRTLKLNNLKMIVLDEADEMLSMGFKEDIETILKDTPEERQSIFFSATMPRDILALAEQFQKHPQVVEINKKQVTLEEIDQSYMEVPAGRKMDGLNLLLHYHQPKRAMIFCNTKRMVDEITEYLLVNGFDAEGLHGDMKQMQRTKVMDAFKSGRISLLIATDVAARGIDVNDIDYVINYDIPQNTEYYVHRIGRTGRAGKSGNAITLCSGRKQVSILRNIGHVVKSDIKMMDIPSMEDIRQKNNLKNMAIVEDALADKISPSYKQIVDKLIEQGHAPEDIAAACLNLHFSLNDSQLNDIKIAKKEVKHSSKFSSKDFRQVQIDIGRNQRIAPNHIVGAMTQITELSGKDIGKIDIFDDTTIVSIPAESVKQVLEDMTGCKIGGHNTKTTLLSDKKLPISKKRVDKSGKPMDKTVKAKDKFFEKYAVEKRKKPSRRKYSHKEQ